MREDHTILVLACLIIIKKVQIGVINSSIKILLLLQDFYKSTPTNQSKKCKGTDSWRSFSTKQLKIKEEKRLNLIFLPLQMITEFSYKQITDFPKKF